MRMLGVIGLLAAAAVTMRFIISRPYHDAAKQQQVLVEVVGLEGDAWGVHGMLGAAIDGSPQSTIDEAMAAINADIHQQSSAIARLGGLQPTARFLHALDSYRSDADATLALIRSDGRAAASGRYLTTNQRSFQTLLSIATATRRALESDGAEAATRGDASTLIVLLCAALTTAALGIQLSRHRRLRAVAEATGAEQDRLNAMIEHAPDMITIWDENDAIVYDSPAVERLLGFKLHERTGTMPGATAHPDDKERVAQFKAALRENPGKPSHIEYRLQDSTGDYHWIEATAANLCDVPAVRGFVANYRIIDGRKQAETTRQQLTSRLIAAQEEERRRIAADIHDDSVQVMAAVQVRLHALTRVGSDEERTEAISYLEETVRLSITRLRRLLFELRPTSLDREGLAAALRANLEMMSKEISISHSVAPATSIEPPLETRVVLYRIAQEALANVRKHSSATRVNADLSVEQGTYVVRIQDDGIGFDTGALNEPGHLGLIAMQERAEEIGGGVRIESFPNQGTTVTIWAPLPVIMIDEPVEVGAA